MFKFWMTCVLVVLASSASAANTDWGKARLIGGWTESSGDMVAAIRIDLNPGWKTYWRVPGAAGIPPSFNWIGSVNLRAAEVLFPRPEVETVAGLQSIGYHGLVVLPIRVVPERRGESVDLALDFSFGVCEEICIPAQQAFSIRLDPTADGNRDVIGQALKMQPLGAASAGVISAECTVSAAGQDFRLTAAIRMASPPKPVVAVVIEPGSPDLWLDAAAVRREGDMLIAEAPMQFYGGGGLLLERSRIRLTLLGEGYAIDIQGCPA